MIVATSDDNASVLYQSRCEKDGKDFIISIKLVNVSDYII